MSKTILPGRRKFMKSAAVALSGGVVAATVPNAVFAASPAKLSATKKLAPQLSRTDKLKNRKALQAEKLLQSIDPSIKIEWVKGSRIAPRGRRIIQVKG